MTNAANARESAGLSPDVAARRLRVSLAYLQRLERGVASWSFVLATRAAALYRARIDIFLTRKTERRAAISHTCERTDALISSLTAGAERYATDTDR